MDIERHEAIGQRGEACIVIAKAVVLPNGQGGIAYNLATGERLLPAGIEGHFATADGRRRFRFRDAAPFPEN